MRAGLLAVHLLARPPPLALPELLCTLYRSDRKRGRTKKECEDPAQLAASVPRRRSAPASSVPASSSPNTHHKQHAYESSQAEEEASQRQRKQAHCCFVVRGLLRKARWAAPRRSKLCMHESSGGRGGGERRGERGLAPDCLAAFACPSLAGFTSLCFPCFSLDRRTHALTIQAGPPPTVLERNSTSHGTQRLLDLTQLVVQDEELIR
jgi:hypothetical protein